MSTTDSATADTIRLTGLSARGYHGVLPFERQEGQLFAVDVVLKLGPRGTAIAAVTDSLNDAVDYGSVAGAVVAIIQGEPVGLIETLAERISDAVLAFPRVQGVEVTVHKPYAPLDVAFEDVSVTIVRDGAGAPAQGAGAPGYGAGAPAQGVGAPAHTLAPASAGSAPAAVSAGSAPGPVSAGSAPAAVSAGSAPAPAASTPAPAAAASMAATAYDAPGPEAARAPFAPSAGSGAEHSAPDPYHSAPDPLAPAAPEASGPRPGDRPGAPEAGPTRWGGASNRPAEPAPDAATPYAPQGGEAPAPYQSAQEAAPAPVAAPPAPEPVDPLTQRPDRPVGFVIALGGNVGGVVQALRTAVATLRSTEGVTVTDIAPLARTAALVDENHPAQPDYLNTVVIGTATLAPRELLELCHTLEADAGRVRTEPKGPRTLDADLITVEGVTSQDPELTLPHPHASQRAFVLVPWAQADPFAELAGQSVATLAQNAPDADGVRWLALDWLDSDRLPALPTGQYVEPPAAGEPTEGREDSATELSEAVVDSEAGADAEPGAEPQENGPSSAGSIIMSDAVPAPSSSPGPISMPGGPRTPGTPPVYNSASAPHMPPASVPHPTPTASPSPSSSPITMPGHTPSPASGVPGASTDRAQDGSTAAPASGTSAAGSWTSSATWDAERRNPGQEL